MQYPVDQEVMKFNLQRILGDEDLKIPANYLVFDLETTGLNAQSHHIWQFGYFVVQAGQPVYPQGKSVWATWPESELVRADFEINRRANLVRVDPEKGIVKDAHYEACEREFVDEVTAKGIDFKDALRVMTNMLLSYAESGYPIVGQNASGFDAGYLEWECKKLGIDFEFPYSNLIDVGILIKGARLGTRIADHETVKQFYKRVSSTRRTGLYYSIARFILPHYQLIEKYDLDVDKLHDAGADAFVTHLALHEMMLEALGG